jgi:hypothetical protein
MFSRANIYRLSLLLTLLGITGFIINAKGMVHASGLLLLSILLIIIPAAYIALNWNIYDLTKTQSLSLVIIPLIILNYIYYIIVSLPVGFNDSSFHIIQCLHLFGDGVIQFPKAQMLSYNFVGLYIIFHSLEAISSLNISTLACIIPPIFNLSIILTVYLIVDKLHSHKVALIAMMFYGWENQVLLFGQEMRTQTLGTLLLFIILLFEYSNFKMSVSSIILIIIILSSSVMSSFASIFSTSFVIFVTFVTSMILCYKLKWPKITSRITWGLFGFYLSTFFAYIIYISGGFDNIFYSIKMLYNSMIANSDATEFSGNQLVKSTGQTMYGNFVQYSTYLFWTLFFIFSIVYLMMIIKGKKSVNLKFFVGFYSLIFYTFFNIFAGVISMARIYIIVFILIATVMSYGLFKLQDILKNKQFTYTSNIFVILIIAVFVISSAVKLPNYIVGDTNPIRSEEVIDSISYWDSDIPQYSVDEFLSLHAANQSLIDYSLTTNYFSLQLIMKSIVGQEQLSILHDKFRGKYYMNRDQLPPYQKFERSNQIYSNEDYLVFK